MSSKRFASFTVALALALVLALMPPARPVQADTYTVTNTNNSGVGSLRWAINQANANPGADTITFNIPGAGVHTITPLTALPTLTDSGTTIDGYTQSDATPATSTAPAVIRIEINGTNVTANNGLNITSANNVIRGLAINRFGGNGIAIGYSTAHDNYISGNHIGTNAAGTADLGNGAEGVSISLGALNNFVGGSTPSTRNVISGNGWGGVAFHGSDTTGNCVVGNYIGTNADGTAALGNTLYGVRIYGGAHRNYVAQCAGGARNIISGNVGDGVRIAGDGTDDNIVSGNWIGLTRLGAALGNSGAGVYITLGAQYNVVGGILFIERNIISANSENGLVISGTNTMSNTVYGNYIGTSVDGANSLGNVGDGVRIAGGASGNTIGGNTAGQRNIISGNDQYGVSISDSGTTSNTVSGNYIGTDVNGTADRGNTLDGVYIVGAQNNTVGGDTAGERNVISGNDSYGVYIYGSGTTGNTVSGNYIGTDAGGTADLGNSGSGVYIYNQAQNNTVGGDAAGERNVISGNDASGVMIWGSGTTGNTVSGNYIGTDVNGTADRGNGYDGVYIALGAQNNTVGGDTAGERNVISGNQRCGVEIRSSGTTGNVVSGNYIGIDVNGTAGLGNTWDGVYIDGAQNNTVGGDTAGERNVISGNHGTGVLLYRSGTMSNTVSGNYIGTDVNGTADLGNRGGGVYILGAQNNTVGGDTAGERNVISGNDRNGVRIAYSGAMSNTVSGNYIGTDVNGTAGLGNTLDGVYIYNGAQNNTVGPDNVIAYNDDVGVLVDQSSTTGNTITQNSIFANGWMGIDLREGANGGIAAPVIAATTPGSVHIVGTACADCTVEVFENSDTDGEGETYVGDTTATASGAFTVTVSSLTQPYLTATATGVVSGTSEFSAVFTATVPLAPPVGPIYLPIILKNH